MPFPKAPGREKRLDDIISAAGKDKREGVIGMFAQNQSFEGVTISLDGGSFYSCRFERCKLDFRGLLPVILDACQFNNCTWEFGGPAANTVGFLSALFKAGARDLVDGTLRCIRGEQASSPISLRP